MTDSCIARSDLGNGDEILEFGGGREDVDAMIGGSNNLGGLGGDGEDLELLSELDLKKLKSKLVSRIGLRLLVE